jgi:hypothetical protein
MKNTKSRFVSSVKFLSADVRQIFNKVQSSGLCSWLDMSFTAADMAMEENLLFLTAQPRTFSFLTNLDVSFSCIHI